MFIEANFWLLRCKCIQVRGIRLSMTPGYVGFKVRTEYRLIFPKPASAVICTYDSLLDLHLVGVRSPGRRIIFSSLAPIVVTFIDNPMHRVRDARFLCVVHNGSRALHFYFLGCIGRRTRGKTQYTIYHTLIEVIVEDLCVREDSRANGTFPFHT
jgi:hypothetical protein